MPLTKEQEKAYMEENGRVCPFCGSDDIETEAGTHVQIDGPECTNDMQCNACDETFIECFKLCGVMIRESRTPPPEVYPLFDPNQKPSKPGLKKKKK